MAITISYLNSPQNVRATLQDGGDLLPNTTYYVIVIARNNSSLAISDNLLLSPPSEEISFTTTDTMKSALIEWDSMGSGIYYDVCVTTTSGDYVFYSTNKRTCATASLSTNSYLLTAPPNTSYFPNIPTYIYNSFGFSRNIGNIIVYVSGNETPYSIAQQIEAQFPDNIKYGKIYEYGTSISYFYICGSIIINSGVTGSLNWGNIIFATYFGGLHNYSTSFSMSFGSLQTSNPQIVSFGSRIMFHSINCYLYNIYFYGCHFVPVYSIDAYTYYGYILYFSSGYVIDCMIDYPRIDSGCNYSYSKVRAMSMFRSWGGVIDTKAEFHSINVAIGYYPRNGYHRYYDCIFKFASMSYHISTAGYNNNPYGWISSHYDSKFITSDGTGLEYIKFNNSAITGVSGMKFYYSVSVNVRDKNGALSNATVKCYDKNNDLLFEKITDSSGNIEKTYIERLRVTFLGDGVENVDREWFTPLKIVISKAGYQDLEITNLDFIEDTPIVLTSVMKLLPLEISSFSFTHPSGTNNDGTITIDASGGSPPYYYSINDGESYESTNQFSNLSAGTYYIKVKDSEDSSTNSYEIKLTNTEYILYDPVYGNIEQTKISCNIDSTVISGNIEQTEISGNVSESIIYGNAEIDTVAINYKN